MKKIYLAGFLALAFGGNLNAQVSKGGMPFSFTKAKAAVETQVISKMMLPEPDYAKLEREDLQDATLGIAKPYRVAATVNTDISFNNSGTWLYNNDGSIIWRLEVEVPNAKALSFYYDQFNFPEGVSLYVYNADKSQILGAYTSINNSKYNIFSNEELLGNKLTLEININRGVNLGDVSFHLNKVYAFYRGVSDLVGGTGNSATPLKPTIDESSSCHINAVCPQAAGAQFDKARNATVRMFANGGLCTGTLINNTGNSQNGTCKPYILTASHCDGANSRNDADFAGMQFRFNYQYANCGADSVSPSQTRTGAYMRSRSNLPSIPNAGNAYVADMMLLEMVNTPPTNSDAYLIGWNRNIGIANNEDYDHFIGFHHPSGDAKKMSFGSTVYATGNFNQSAVANTHWDITFSVGGTSPGSSGSGLFDKDGLIMGDLSGGPYGSCDGKEFGQSALYSKISYSWDNEFDQTTFPAFAGAPSRLKDWLDPLNTGVITLASTKSDCSDMTGVSVNDINGMLDKSISIFPNPSVDGNVQVAVNLSEAQNIAVSVFDIRGVKVLDFNIKNARSGQYSLDLSSVANGMYLIKFATDAKATTSKKVLIAK